MLKHKHCHLIYLSTVNIMTLLLKFQIVLFCCAFFVVGDGRLGFPDEAPYDAIHVGAAAPTLPKAVCALCI